MNYLVYCIIVLLFMKTSCYHVYTDVPFRDVVGWKNVPETFSDDQPAFGSGSLHLVMEQANVRTQDFVGSAEDERRWKSRHAAI